ncbi:P-type conjugative transfer protein TrbL [Kistimonas asteriae]|uniref:P-type conjugative transfer protein TrbL n=1 Tax=Kistimonas asteriae TaxID=517724 RepID=UPI001BA5B7F4|nr:P-type conjugative transfer protein TrbL [Kistimonas asteriae]
MKSRVICTQLPLLLVVLLVSTELFATQSINVSEDIISRFEEVSSSWRNSFQSLALSVFGIIIVIDLAWSGINLVKQQAGFQECVGELISRSIFYGFFYALIIFASRWTGAILESFDLAAIKAAGESGVTPVYGAGSVFNIGLDIVQTILEAMSLSQLAASIALVVAAAIIMIVFAIMSATLVLALCEMYIVLSAGVLILGFCGSRWSHEIALNYYKYAFTIGLKVFTLKLIMTTGQAIITNWLDVMEVASADSAFAMVGAAIVLLMLVQHVPETMQRLLAGALSSGGESMVGAGAGQGMVTMASGAIGGMVAGAISAGTSGVGAGSALKAAVGLAGDQGAGAEGGMKGAMGMAGQTAKNLFQSGASDVKGKMAGDISKTHGQRGFRMGQDMNEQRERLREAMSGNSDTVNTIQPGE